MTSLDSRLPQAPLRLLDQVRERIRYLHYSLRTEQAYVHWVRAYVRFHGLRHPKEMGQAEVVRCGSTHVLKLGGGAVRSPLDALALPAAAAA